MNQRWVNGTVAVLAAMALNFLGDWLLGARIEVFRGMDTFSLAWALDIFMVPFLTGLLVAKIFGRHAKWLACVPPLIVRFSSYLYLYYLDRSHDFFFNFHLHYWGVCVILAVESANFGGIIGEVLVGVYVRKNAAKEKPEAAVESSNP